MHVCPNCGYCPCCGRPTQPQFQPYNPYYGQPYWGAPPTPYSGGLVGVTVTGGLAEEFYKDLTTS